MILTNYVYYLMPFLVPSYVFWPNYEHLDLPNDFNKIVRLHIILRIKKNVFTKLCAKIYAAYDGLVNGDDSLFKTTTCVSKKSYMWIDFLNPKISYHTRHKNAIL